MTSTAEFWNRVAEYNEATWPISVAMTIGAAFLTLRLFARSGAKTDIWTKVFLSFAFAWNGLRFFLISVKNPISTFIGAPVFIVIAVLFAVDLRTPKTRFRLPETTWKRGITIFWITLVFLYPVIGWPLGHVYPKMLLPMFPCPLTVFAIALVAAAAPNADKKLLILLLPWALLGLPKCFGALDCYEDCILFASGVYGLVALIRNWKTGRGQVREPSLAQQEASG